MNNSNITPSKSTELKTLHFNDIPLSVIDHQGKPWLQASQIAKALGYESEKSVTNLYNSNKEEFSDGMTEVIKSVTSGNLQVSSRIFSPRACHLIAMFARTARAQEFRKWVLDVLDKETEQKTEPQFKIPQTLSEALFLASDLAKRVEVLEPKAEICDRIHNSINAVPIDQFAKELGIGQNRCFEILREQGYVRKDGGCNTPYQDYINNGFFKVVPRPWLKDGQPQTYPRIMVTGKGATYFAGNQEFMDAVNMKMSNGAKKARQSTDLTVGGAA